MEKKITQEKLQKIAKKYKSLFVARCYEIAIEELENKGQTTTLYSDVADILKKEGYKVTEKNINYLISK